MQEQVAAFASRFFSWGFYSADLSFMLCAIILLGHLDRKPRTMALRVGDLLAMLFVEALLCLAKYLLTGDPGSLPVLVAVLVVYALLQDRIRTTDKIARCATFVASNVLLIGIVGVLAVVLGLGEANPLRWVMPNVGSFVILLAVTLFLRRFAVSRFRYVPRGFAYMVLAMCLVASVIGWTLMIYNMPDASVLDGLNTAEQDLAMRGQARINLVVEVGLLFLVLISYRMFYLLSEEHDERARRLVARRVASDNAEMIGVTKSVYETMREVRHETKNRVAYMQALLDDGQYERLDKYFETFRKATGELLDYVQSGNTTVDAVVNSKIALAKSQGIEVKTMLAIPHELGFAEEDLFTLIANLMDNAIEGAVASEATDKVVRLSIRPEGGYYIITVQNPCAGRKDRSGALGALRTTKDDKEVHGYGTKVISRIARRHNGTARYQVKDDVFTATVMLAQADENTQGVE